MFDFKKILLTSNSKVKDALEMIDKSAIKIALVSDKQGILKGVITDGDIRRALINGVSFEEKIENIYNKNPIICKQGSSMFEIENLFIEKQVLHVVEINDQNKIINLHIAKNLSARSENYTAVIMAGGLGSRLMPLTENLPKPMIKINGKPILEIIIENLKLQGFAKIFISVNYKKEIIMEYFKNGQNFGLEIEYLIEEKKLGTAGSLALLPLDFNDHFIVTNADIISNIRFESLLERHIASKSICSILTTIYKIEVPYGVIQTDEKGYFKSIEEKPVYDFLINSGIYALSPEILKFVPKNEFFNMTDLIEVLAKKKGKINLVTSNSFWNDIGRKEDLEKFNFTI